MWEHQINIDVKRDPVSLGLAQCALQTFIEDHHVTDDAAMRAILIHKEIAGNAVRYGNGEDLSCSYGYHDKTLVTRYCYSTDPFDSSPPPQDDIFAESGRGLLLIHALADEVEFSIGKGLARITAQICAS